MNPRHHSTSLKLSETPVPGLCHPPCPGTAGCTFSPSMTAIRHQSAQKRVPNDTVTGRADTAPRPPAPAATLSPFLPRRCGLLHQVPDGPAPIPTVESVAPAVTTYRHLPTVPTPEGRLLLQLPAPSRHSDRRPFAYLCILCSMGLEFSLHTFKLKYL